MSKKVKVNITEWFTICDECMSRLFGDSINVFTDTEDDYINIYTDGVHSTSGGFCITLTKEEGQRLVDTLTKSLSKIKSISEYE